MNQFIMDVRNAEREESEMSAVRKNQAAKKNRTVNAEKKQAENKSPLAWYDDRVKTLKAPASDNPCPAPGLTEFDVFDPDGFTGYDTPKQIYNYLNQYVWKQDEAKKAAALIVYKCLHGIKDNAMFIGPTGCGKTHIWRCLKEIFPSMIAIVDGSSISQEGWKGSTKWKDLLKFPAAYLNHGAILVVDEADKMLTPKHNSSDENVSHNVQAEALKMMEGCSVQVEVDSVTYEVDTSKISFVLCGAFSSKARSLAAEHSGKRIGFGAAAEACIKPYEKALDEQDLIDFGVMPEFMGRIQQIVSLKPMELEDYYEMIGSFGSVLQRIEQQYNAAIRLSPKRQREVAEQAYRSGLGVRDMENRIRRLVDNEMFEHWDTYEFEL